MSSPVFVDLEASLECELDEHPVSVNASEGVIIVNVEAPKTARSIIKVIRRFGTLRSSVARGVDALLLTSHRLELHVNDVMVAKMGHDTPSGLLKWAGLKHVRVWPFRLLRRHRSG